MRPIRSVVLGADEMRSLLDLGPVDMKIARLVLEGATNKSIARAVGLPEGTVKGHLHRMYRRMNVVNRTQFVLRVQELITKESP